MRLENEKLGIEFLPELGGKIISFYMKESKFELAAQNEWKSQRPQEYSELDFGDYAYGLDDCFPCIDEEVFPVEGEMLHYPNHGEIWKNGMTCREIRQNREYELFFESKAFSYEYTKRYCLLDCGLRIQVKIKNTGDKRFPAIWTWHGLMRYEEDMQVELPGMGQSASEIQIRNVLENEVLGDVGRIYSLNQGGYDFSRVPKADSKSMVKYYLEGEVPDGTCGFYYPARGVRVNLEYDCKKLPYLGVWMTVGGLDGAYNCALEPCNGFYDSISCAHANSRLKWMEPGETVQFELTIHCQQN